MILSSCAAVRFLRLSRRVLLGLALLTIAPASLRAQTSASDKALAENLFDRGLALMRQNQFAEACAQLEQSEAIERGIGTMLYLGECYEKLGRTASAWATFREAASAARAEGQGDRAKTGAARADRLEPKLSKLTIHVQLATAPNGLTLLRNGEVLPNAVWGAPVPVDPGEQHIEARAPGKVSWAVSVSLPPNGATLNVDVPELVNTPVSVQPMAAAAPVPAPATALPTAPAAATTSDDARTWQKPLALVVGGVGVVALGLGAYFGGHAISKTSELDHACPKNSCGDIEARRFQSAAHSAATAANVFVISGAVLLAGGVVLYVTRPSEESLHVAVNGAGGAARIELGGTL